MATPPHVRSRVQGENPPPPSEAPVVYNIFNAKYCLNLFYFNTFFLQIFNYKKKNGGVVVITRATPCQKGEGIYPHPHPRSPPLP